MISSIKGNLIEINDNNVVVDVNDVGFLVFLPTSSFSNLPKTGEEIRLFTYMNVKEDEISLYGFLEKEDREMFLRLISVSGVGPKGALNIISNFGSERLISIISNEDSKLLSTVSGIGAKTAGKICIELADKVKKLKFGVKVKRDNISIGGNEKINNIRDEVVLALTKLGYKESKARDMILSMEIDENDNASDILKKVLKNF